MQRSMCIALMIVPLLVAHTSAQKDEPDPNSPEEVLHDALMAVAPFMVTWSVVPGLEYVEIMAAHDPRFKGFADRLVIQITTDSAKERSNALAYLAGLASCVRSAAWDRDGIEPKDSFRRALGRHEEKISSAILKSSKSLTGT